MTRLQIFRHIAHVEGVTTLALFLVAMPVKYGLGSPVLVPPIGWLHGLAFIAYLLAMFTVLPRYSAGAGGIARTFIASVVPFGTFVNDRYIRSLASK